MLSRLSHWRGTTGLRSVGASHADANPRQEPEDWRPSAEHWVGGEAERGAGEGDDNRPGERAAVFATWGDPTKRLCEVVVTVRALATEAATLSFMSRGPYDVRPVILLAMYAEDLASMRVCVRYCERYLAAKFGKEEVPNGAAIRWAAADGFGVVFGARERRVRGGTPERAYASADDRARQLKVRASHFRMLRGAAVRVYERRFAEAKEAYCLAQMEAGISP
jgi:hypothetical protein